MHSCLEYIELIEKHTMFMKMSREQILQVTNLLDAFVIDVPKDTIVNRIFETTYPRYVGCMLSGWAQFAKEDAWGRKVILDFVMPNYFFGSYNLISNSDFHEADVTMTEDGLLLIFPGDCLKDTSLIAANPELIQLICNLNEILSIRTSRLLGKNIMLSCRSLREKILTYLSFEREYHQSNEFDIPFDRQELADYLYIDRSALSKNLALLQEEGLLEYHKNHFILKGTTLEINESAHGLFQCFPTPASTRKS